MFFIFRQKDNHAKVGLHYSNDFQHSTEGNTVTVTVTKLFVVSKEEQNQ